MFNDCLIMAGGSGTRLWPASNSKKPKQFLSITERAKGTEGVTFFDAAIERALLSVEGTDGRVIIIAGKSHIPHVIESCAKLDTAGKKHLVVIPEPEAKSTAPAIACASVYAGLGGGAKNRTMLVLTSDHIIKPLETFKANAAAAAWFAERGNLAVFGIPPTRPETGYGYIETGKAVKVQAPLSKGVYRVAAFREKPDLQTAKKFTASKRFFWNSGMFAFSTSFMTESFQSLAPEVIRPFEKLKVPDAASYTVKKGLRVLNAWAGLEAAYRKTKSISFDYAIAEKCGQAVMVRADFDWIDIGNWEEYAALLRANAGDNAAGSAGAEVYYSGQGTNTCFVDSDIPTALAGVEDLIVVIRSGKNGSPPLALITQKGETQRVRDITEQLKKAGKEKLL